VFGDSICVRRVKGWPPEAEVRTFWALLRDFTAGVEGVLGGLRVKIANSRTGDMVFVWLGMDK